MPDMGKPKSGASDPFVIVSIPLTDEQSGPNMHLLKSSVGNMWMQFDKRPPLDITNQLKSAGWHWESRAWHGENKGAWLKPIGKGSEQRTPLEAERLFNDLAKQIRHGNGLTPSTLAL